MELQSFKQIDERQCLPLKSIKLNFRRLPDLIVHQISKIIFLKKDFLGKVSTNLLGKVMTGSILKDHRHLATIAKHNGEQASLPEWECSCGLFT
jgi:hypothetical protein